MAVPEEGHVTDLEYPAVAVSPWQHCFHTGEIALTSATGLTQTHQYQSLQR